MVFGKISLSPLLFSTVTDVFYRQQKRARESASPLLEAPKGDQGHPPHEMERPRDDARLEEGVEPVIASDKNHDQYTTGISFHVILPDPGLYAVWTDPGSYPDFIPGGRVLGWLYQD